MPKGKSDYRFQGKRLTGINDLKGKIKTPVVILGSGTSLRDLDPAWIPQEWPLVAVNEAVAWRPERNDYWVLSDRPIVSEYAAKCAPGTTILAMHDAIHTIGDRCPKNLTYTTVSMADPDKRYRNGYEFFSRGTVLIGAIEMLKWMGAKEFYVFGLDCFRKEGRAGYYFDNRRTKVATEHLELERERVRLRDPKAPTIFITRRLGRMIDRLAAANEAGLWNKVKVHCVNSPFSQNRVFPQMDAETFQGAVTKWREENPRDAEPEDGLQPGEPPEGGEDLAEAEAPEDRDPGQGVGDGGGEPSPPPDAGAGGGDPGEGDPRLPGDRDPSGGDEPGDDHGAEPTVEQDDLGDV